MSIVSYLQYAFQVRIQMYMRGVMCLEVLITKGMNTMVHIIMGKFPKLPVNYLGIEITSHITEALCFVSFFLHF